METIEMARAPDKAQSNSDIIQSTIDTYNETHGLETGWVKIVDIINKKLVHKATSRPLLAERYLTEDWKNTYSWDKRTIGSYYQMFLKDYLEKNTLSPDNRTDLLLDEANWIPLDKCYLNGTKFQRIQIAYTKDLMEKAVNFDWRLALIKVAVIPGSDKYYVVEGGGTLCSAAMRGIDYIPVVAQKVESEEKAGELYNIINKTRKAIGKNDDHNADLNSMDDDSLFAQRILHSSGDITFTPYAAGFTYSLDVSAVKKILHWKTSNATGNGFVDGDYVSGDSISAETIDRDGSNFVDALDIIKEVWPNENANPEKTKIKINSNTFKLITAGLALVDPKLMKTHTLVKLLKQVKSGKLVINNVDFCPAGKTAKNLDLSTTVKLSETLHIGQFGDRDYRYGYFFCNFWNVLVKEAGLDNLKISKDYIKSLKEEEIMIKYDSNKDYNGASRFI